MNCADRKDLVETEFDEFCRSRLGSRGIHLIDRDQDGLAAAAQPLGGFAIQRHNSLLHIDHQNDEIGGLNRQLHLFQRCLADDIPRFLSTQQTDAAGID